MKYLINNEEVEFEVKSITQNVATLILNEREYIVSLNSLNTAQANISIGNQKKSLDFIIDKGAKVFNFNGKTFKVEEASLNHSSSSLEKEGELISPMPGKVFKVLKNIGDSVHKGETIIVLEAMKMEHEIKSSKDSVIKSILFHEGDQVGHGDLLVELDD